MTLKKKGNFMCSVNFCNSLTFTEGLAVREFDLLVFAHEVAEMGGVFKAHLFGRSLHLDLIEFDFLIHLLRGEIIPMLFCDMASGCGCFLFRIHKEADFSGSGAGDNSMLFVV